MLMASGAQGELAASRASVAHGQCGPQIAGGRAGRGGHRGRLDSTGDAHHPCHQCEASIPNIVIGSIIILFAINVDREKHR